MRPSLTESPLRQGRVSEVVPIGRGETGALRDADSCQGHTASRLEPSPALSPALDLKQ